jgi:hypothetical protein
MNDLIYAHPKFGWGRIVAVDKDDGAAKIFQPIDPQDGDDSDWNTPLHYVEMDELKLVPLESWYNKFPESDRKFPSDKEREENKNFCERRLYESLKKKFETNN